MRHLLAACTFVALLAVVGSPATWAAPTTINVELSDPSSAAGIDGMEMKSDHATVKAGLVRFHVVNKSRSVVHEMIVVALTSPGETLPYNPNAGRVLEKKIHHLGEVSDVPPGKSGNLQLTLKSGSYILICNQPGHYEAGMKTPLTVTP